MWRVIYFMRYAWFVNYLCLVVKISFPWGFSDNDWFKTWRMNFVKICAWNGITMPPFPPSLEHCIGIAKVMVWIPVQACIFCSQFLSPLREICLILTNITRMGLAGQKINPFMTRSPFFFSESVNCLSCFCKTQTQWNPDNSLSHRTTWAFARRSQLCLMAFSKRKITLLDRFHVVWWQLSLFWLVITTLKISIAPKSDPGLI